jgi:hypothetical protein
VPEHVAGNERDPTAPPPSTRTVPAAPTTHPGRSLLGIFVIEWVGHWGPAPPMTALCTALGTSIVYEYGGLVNGVPPPPVNLVPVVLL